MISRSNPIDVHVGKRLRMLRQTKDMTQEELGELVAVSYQQIQKYETGANRISASRLYLIARRLGVGPAFFFEGLEDTDDAALMRHVGLDGPVAAGAHAG